jgi:transcription antitermination factor NusG
MVENPANEKKWHVITTRSRTEKKVYASLQSKNIECFLPLQKKLRHWKDRKKWVEMPVISGYCFVKINKLEMENVLNTQHIVNFIRFEGKPASISSIQMEFLKKMLSQSDFEVEVSKENFKPGKKVEIIDGPMAGIQGELISCRGKDKFILRIQQIKTTYLVEISAEKIVGLPAHKQI